MPWPLYERPTNVVSTFTSFVPGYRLVDAEDLLNMAQMLLSSHEGIRGGTTQLNGPMLDSYINTVAVGSTVSLPPALPGRSLFVINNTPSNLQVFGDIHSVLTGTQDKVDGGILVTQPAGSVAQYLCNSLGEWRMFISGGAGVVVPSSLWGSMIWGKGVWGGSGVAVPSSSWGSMIWGQGIWGG